MAEGGVAELGQLRVVGDASGQGFLGAPLPLWVGERQSGQLLGARQASGSVAP